MSAVITAEAHWQRMTAAREAACKAIEAKRHALVEELRLASPNPGSSCPPAKLTELCEAIHEIDGSLTVPAQLKARRAYVTCWYEDNDGKDPSHQQSFEIVRLRWVQTTSIANIEAGRTAEGGAVDDYHVQRSKSVADYDIRANRTHCFVRPGYRYLCERDQAWVELEVAEGAAGAGHVGHSRVVTAATNAEAVLTSGAPGEECVWGFQNGHVRPS